MNTALPCFQDEKPGILENANKSMVTKNMTRAKDREKDGLQMA